MLRLFISFLILFVIKVDLFGQNRYMVFFTDKDNTPYSINEPLTFLSQRSLDRRAKNGFEVTEDDLPVDPTYVSQLSSLGAGVYFTSRWFNAALVQMNTSLEDEVAGLSFVDSLLLVALDPKLSKDQVPIEIATSFITPDQTNYSTNLQNDMLGIDIASGDGLTGEGILIAVLDGGFAGVNNSSPFQHLHESGQIIGVKDFVTNSGNPYLDGIAHDHGTKVLSTMAGIFEPHFNGIATASDYLLLVTEEVEEENPVEEWNWVLGTEYADSAGADVINSSLGYGIYFDDIADYPSSVFDGKTTVPAIAANLAAERGILIVTSVGNDGTEKPVLSPADSPDVLAVGATTYTGGRASFSTTGPTADGRLKPDVSAVGQGTIVIDKNASIAPGNGTSFSSPLIAGLVALVIEAYPDLTVSQLLNLIRITGNQIQSPDNQLGYGIPSYSRIESNVNETLLGFEDVQSNIKIYPSPFEDQFSIEGNLSSFNSYQLYDLWGKVILSGNIDPGIEELKIHFEEPVKQGLYLFILQSGNNKSVFKVIKR
ncbi:MAG: S8 family peptidase [Bacteroidota bacterium]